MILYEPQGSMCGLKSSGSITDPCGTPHKMLTSSDVKLVRGAEEILLEVLRNTEEQVKIR